MLNNNDLNSLSDFFDNLFILETDSSVVDSAVGLILNFEKELSDNKSKQLEDEILRSIKDLEKQSLDK